MSDSKNINLLVISVEKLNTMYNKYSIPKHVEDIEETYIEALESKWIRPKQMFFFINNGEILSSDTKIKSINTDIILLTCNNVNDFKIASSVTNNSVLINDISDLIGRTMPSNSTSSVLPYINSASLNINSNIPQPIVPFNSLDTLSSVLENGSSVQSIFSGTSDTNPNSGSQLMQEFRTTMRNMLNSVNVVIDNDNETSNQPLLTNSVNNEDINNSTTQSTIINIPTSSTEIQNNNVTTTNISDSSVTSNNDEHDGQDEDHQQDEDNRDAHDDTNTQDNSNNQSNDEDAIDNINEQGTNAELINNTVTQLLSMYNTSVNNSYNSLLSRYSEQIEQMRNMGFTDESKILVSLYVSEGNFESAVNYYLSLPDD
jgi:hypothetical protein